MQPGTDLRLYRCHARFWLEVSPRAHAGLLSRASRLCARWAHGGGTSCFSDLGLLGELECIINLDAEVSHG